MSDHKRSVYITVRLTPQYKRQSETKTTIGKTSIQNIHTENEHNGNQMECCLLQTSFCICNCNRNTCFQLRGTVRKTKMQSPHTPHSTQHHAQFIWFYTQSTRANSFFTQKTNLTLSCYRYTQQREAAVEREGERKRRRTTVLAFHFAESQPCC